MDPLVQYQGRHADKSRRAGKASVAVVTAKELKTRRLSMTLQASGLLLSALLALLLMRP